MFIDKFLIFRFMRRELKHLMRVLSPRKRRIRERWLHHDGLIFMHDLGVSEGDVVLDFGSGPGFYAIPAARQVRGKGLVVAVEKQARVLRRLKHNASSDGVRDIIITALGLDEAIDCLDGRLCQTVLIFDVLHYMERTERLELYKEFRKLLNRDGVLAVHPKHAQGDQGAGHLVDTTVKEIIGEIESAGYRLLERRSTRLWHDHDTEFGVMLSFKII